TPLSQLTLSAATSDPNLIKDVTFITAGTSASATITTVSNAFGVATVTISVSDGTSASSQTFTVNVTKPCEPPVIGTIAPQTASGSTITVPIPVTDPNDPLTNLVFSASTAGNSIVSDATFAVNGNAVNATFTLFPGATGTEQVTVSAADGCS